MSFGNNGAGPQGAPIFGNQGTAAAGAVPGQAGAPGNGATPIYNAGFESVLAAVSRGELPLNMLFTAASGFAGNNAANQNQQGNPTLLQAIQQGVPQNGTNGLGVRSGPSPVGEGTAAVGIGSTNVAAGAQTDSNNTIIVDSRQMSNAQTFANQYGGG